MRLNALLPSEASTEVWPRKGINWSEYKQQTIIYLKGQTDLKYKIGSDQELDMGGEKM